MDTVSISDISDGDITCAQLKNLIKKYSLNVQIIFNHHS